MATSKIFRLTKGGKADRKVFSKARAIKHAFHASALKHYLLHLDGRIPWGGLKGLVARGRCQYGKSHHGFVETTRLDRFLGG